jgi:hypothetical protein
VLGAAEVPAKIELRRIPNDAAARRDRFLSSPTVRVEGRDVEPGAQEREDFGARCRPYQLPTGARGMPLDEWVLDALAHTNA